MSNSAFYNPTDIGAFDLGLTQVNQTMPFESVEGVFDPSAYVQFYEGSRCGERQELIRYEIGSGLEISGNNIQGESKALTLTLNGADFSGIGRGKTLLADCSLFSPGDVEIQFSLLIK